MNYQYWLLTQAVILSVFIALPGTYFARNAAHRFRWLDKPGTHKAHNQAIPLLGGIAMYGTFVCTLLILDLDWLLSEGLTLIIAATLLAGIGLYDDLRGLNPLPKLVGEIIAAIALISSGISLHLTGIEAIDIALTLFWVVGICNAMNLLDNMDALSGGVAAIVCLCFGAIALSQAQIHVAIMCATLFGAILGFLKFNWHPATIFMGDAGSLFVGFLVAAIALMIVAPASDNSLFWLIPIFVLAVPIFDTTLVTISRLRRQLKITDGGRDHTSHRLVKVGLTVTQAVGRLYKVAGVSGAAGVAIALNPSPAIALPSAIFISLCAIGAFFWCEQVDLSDTGQPTHQPSFSGIGCNFKTLRSAQVYERSEL
jgi:UDP-GlcNAc:undecaprenyl-phosphate GlcNAc-1-phosphate transferase